MKYSRALVGLLTVALSSPVLADECSDNCARQHDACIAAPEANRASCAADYAGCLGYNPYEGSFVEPTACVRTPTPPTGTPAPPTGTPSPAPLTPCLQDCQSKYDECINTPGADKATCDEAVGSCRYTCAPDPANDACQNTCESNYNACNSGAGSVTAVCDQARKDCIAKCNSTPKPTPTPAPITPCLKDCQAKYDECIKTPGADKATCDEAVGSCRYTCSPDPANDDCQNACEDKHKTCLSGAAHAGSASTACDDARKPCIAVCNTPKPVPNGPDACAADCAKKHDACNTAPNANHATCAADYARCLGYNPYGGNGGYVEPTACSKAPIKTVTTKPAPQKTVAPEVCCATCTKTYTVCCSAPGSVVETCKTEYVSCLGYNPFDVTPYVEPTACVYVVDKPKTTPVVGKPPVTVNAGGRVQPALALIALGAVALFCKSRPMASLILKQY